VAVHVGEAVVAAGVAERQPLVVEADLLAKDLSFPLLTDLGSGAGGVVAGDLPRVSGVAKSACRRNPPKHADLRRRNRDLSTWPRFCGQVAARGPLTPPAGLADLRHRHPPITGTVRNFP
jgi:hypothetical protein